MTKNRTLTLYAPGSSPGMVTYWFSRSWSTQPKPYVHPLGFSFGNFQQTKYVWWDDSWGKLFAGPFTEPHYSSLHSDNTAYGSIVEEAGNVSQWANNLLEARESISMISSKVTALVKVLQGLRKGSVSQVSSGLGLGKLSNRHQRVVRSAKSVGDKWLEFHFGWVPMIQDIHDGLQTLSGTDFGTRRISGRGWSNSSDQSTRYGSSSGERTDTAWSGRVVTKCHARVRVTNPNSNLANRFGVVNPLSVAWEAVPYSFVVDWFSNVGQVLQSMTDFIGLELTDTYTTRFWAENITMTYVAPHYGLYAQQAAKMIYCTRAIVLPTPQLELKPFKGLSVVRAATAISLLLQHL